MEGVGPGTTLGGRYTATARLEQAHGTERWRASEPELARSVSILCLPATDPRVPAVLDAARVAAGLEIPATVRVLDIGTEGPIAYVVEESLDDAESVAQLVRSGGLPGDEVRRISGEVATALAAAGARGVHHLRLTPESVFRTSEGTVKVRGLATAAALHQVDLGGGGRPKRRPWGGCPRVCRVDRPLAAHRGALLPRSGPPFLRWGRGAVRDRSGRAA